MSFRFGSRRAEGRTTNVYKTVLSAKPPMAAQVTTARGSVEFERAKRMEDGVSLYNATPTDAASQFNALRLVASVSRGSPGWTSSGATLVTAGFNGVKIPEDAPCSMEDIDSMRRRDPDRAALLLGALLSFMENRFPALGIPRGTKNVMEVGTNVDIGVQTAGTTTVPNTTGQNIQAGDVLGFHLPKPKQFNDLDVVGHGELHMASSDQSEIYGYQLTRLNAADDHLPAFIALERKILAENAGGMEWTEDAYIKGAMGLVSRALVSLALAGVITINAGDDDAGAAVGGEVGIFRPLGGVTIADVPSIDQKRTATALAAMCGGIGINAGGMTTKAIRSRVVKAVLDSTGNPVGDLDGLMGENLETAKRFMSRASSRVTAATHRAVKPHTLRALALEPSAPGASVYIQFIR